MPFQAGDREYVLITVGGNDDWGKGDYVLSFALER